MPFSFKEFADALCKAREVHAPRINELIRQIQAVAQVTSCQAIEIVEKHFPGPIPTRMQRVAGVYLAELKRRPDMFIGEANVIDGDVQVLARQVIEELRSWLQAHDARNLFRFYTMKTGIDPYQLGREIANDPDGWFDGEGEPPC